MSLTEHACPPAKPTKIFVCLAVFLSCRQPGPWIENSSQETHQSQDKHYPPHTKNENLDCHKCLNTMSRSYPFKFMKENYLHPIILCLGKWRNHKWRWDKHNSCLHIRHTRFKTSFLHTPLFRKLLANVFHQSERKSWDLGRKQLGTRSLLGNYKSKILCQETIV
jgi:hypothetical protein